MPTLASCRRRRLLGFTVLLAVTGCSSDGTTTTLDRQAVSGKVTRGGQPLDSAVIEFIPATPDAGGGSTGPIKAGAYAIDAAHGPTPGSYKVAITTANVAVDEANPPMPGEAPKPKAETIPKIYNSQTTLKADIKAGESNVFDFTLDGKK